MAKKVVALIKLALQAGKANPAPPVGPALGQHGVNITGRFWLKSWGMAQSGSQSSQSLRCSG